MKNNIIAKIKLIGLPMLGLLCIVGVPVIGLLDCKFIVWAMDEHSDNTFQILTSSFVFALGILACVALVTIIGRIGNKIAFNHWRD